MGHRERARRAARVAAGLSPIPLTPEAEDRSEKAAEELAPALVHVFSQRELAKLHGLELGLGALWRRRGGPGAFNLGRLILGAEHELYGPLDVELSRRHTSTARSDNCYWTAARALLTDPDLSGARYSEGVLIVNNVHGARDRTRGLSAGGLGLGVELQGFLRLADGQVVDPVALVNAETGRHVHSPDAAIASATYITLAEYSAEEVADRWAELPLSLTDPAGCQRAYRELLRVFQAFGAAIERTTGAIL